MKLIINRDMLLIALSHIISVVDSRPGKAILTNVLLRISPEKIRITATNTEVELTTIISGEFDRAEEVTIPARKTLDICKALPDGAEVALSIDGERVTITSGKSRFSLLTLPAQEFPLIETGEAEVSFSLPRQLFRTLLDKTAFAMARQDVRYYLNGVLLEAEHNKLRSVATDGHRLALCEVDVETPAKEKQSFIIPRKGVHELMRLIRESDAGIDVVIKRNHIRVVLDNLVFTSKLIDGKYPDYDKVIPEVSKKIALAQRDMLKESLSRASILSSDKFRGVKISLAPNKLMLHIHNPDEEQADDEIDVEYSGDNLEVGFNVAYLLDAVSVIQTDQVRLSISSPKGGCLVLPGEGDECKYVVMPLLL